MGLDFHLTVDPSFGDWGLPRIRFRIGVDFLGLLLVPRYHGWSEHCSTSMEQGNMASKLLPGNVKLKSHADFMLLFSCLLWDESGINIAINQVTWSHASLPYLQVLSSFTPTSKLKNTGSVPRIGHCLFSAPPLVVWEALKWEVNCSRWAARWVQVTPGLLEGNTDEGQE